MGTSKRTMSNHYKLFVPKDAATQTYHGVTSIQQKLQERFIDKFGGYTKTELPRRNVDPTKATRAIHRQVRWIY